MSLILATQVEFRNVAQGEPVGHARDELDDLLRLLATFSEMLEDPPHGCAGALLLLPRVRAEVDPLEHERAQREHRLADLLALHDVPGSLGGFDEVVHECVDPPRAAVAEECNLLAGKVSRIEDPEADGVVDVVVDVGNPVDDPHDLAFERRGLLLPCVREDSVSNLFRQIQRLGDTQRLLVVPEALVETLLQRRVERVLSGMAERGVAHVVAEPDRLDEVFVQAQRPRDAARDPGRLERVGHPRAVVVARRIDEDLCLALQAPKRLRVQDPVAIALERGAQTAIVFRLESSTCLVGTDGLG